MTVAVRWCQVLRATGIVFVEKICRDLARPLKRGAVIVGGADDLQTARGA